MRVLGSYRSPGILCVLGLQEPQEFWNPRSPGTPGVLESGESWNPRSHRNSGILGVMES